MSKIIKCENCPAIAAKIEAGIVVAHLFTIVYNSRYVESSMLLQPNPRDLGWRIKMRIHYSATGRGVSVSGFVNADDSDRGEINSKINNAVARKLGCNSYWETASGVVFGNTRKNVSGMSVKHNNVSVNYDLTEYKQLYKEQFSADDAAYDRMRAEESQYV